MSSSRRYEILLPLVFNDGVRVPQSLIEETAVELQNKFGAVSWETQVIRGQWQHQGVTYQDSLTRLVVDVADTSPNRDFFVAFKERLKTKFEQLEIWITSHPLDLI